MLLVVMPVSLITPHEVVCSGCIKTPQGSDRRSGSACELEEGSRGGVLGTVPWRGFTSMRSCSAPAEGIIRWPARAPPFAALLRLPRLLHEGVQTTRPALEEQQAGRDEETASRHEGELLHAARCGEILLCLGRGSHATARDGRDGLVRRHSRPLVIHWSRGLTNCSRLRRGCVLAGLGVERRGIMGHDCILPSHTTLCPDAPWEEARGGIGSL